MNDNILEEAVNGIDEKLLEQHVEKKRLFSLRVTNHQSKGETSMKQKHAPNKWFIAFVIAAVLAVAAIIVAVVVGGAPDAPVVETPKDGPETGVYYFDAEDGEYTIHLHSGDRFTLNNGVARVGTYTVSGETISFVFTKESNGTASAKLAGDVLTLSYNGQEIRFLKKTEYTVTFNANGGEGAPANVKVVNGRAIAAVDDPTKAENAFIGWYVDEALTTPYIFGSTPVTADTTLYAKWIKKEAGQIEYAVEFDGADVDTMTTIGGKLHNVPVPTKDGYTFGGWWISMYEDGDKLTSKYTEDTVFTANTTLFAVWVKTEGEKLASPLVDVDANGISWNSVKDASTYAVKITDPNGNVVLEENVSSTTKNFDFSVAGGYVVEVVAVSTNVANNSDATVRYYNAKALNRVSVFEVVEPSTLIFNSVGADKYYITVVCGNPDHKHGFVSNGSSTVYNFANCEMKEGGIEFTVTAVKNGYADSVSKTFVYERKLDKITDLTVDPATETLVWTRINGAMYYIVEVNGVVDYAREAAYSLKTYTGKITVKVTPVTAGYLSETTEYTYEKTALASPDGIVVSNNTIRWNAVTGATSYSVKVGTKIFTAETNSFDLSAVDTGISNGQTVEISVKAEADGKSSVYSDIVIAKSLAFDGELVYKNGIISWTPVIGKGNYEVKVNNSEVVTVSDANSYAVAFTQAGVNTVSVRFVGDITSEWITEEIMVYAIYFDSRLGAGIDPLYIVAGDEVGVLAETVRPGYKFNGWYTTPNASNGNGALYTSLFYTANDDTVLYADWEAEVYKIVYNVDDDVKDVTNGETVDVTFNTEFTLAIPVSDKGSFLGWFTGPDGSGVQVADAYGESTGKYEAVGNTTVYPFFEVGALTYIEQEDGTWGVTAGPNIHNVSNVIIPETYKGIKVTKILENAFKACYALKTISIPNTVNLIGTGAFLGCYEMEWIDVRVIDGGHDVIYSSYEGVLIREYLGTSYLELFPVARKGDYTVPATVDAIRNKAFQYADYLENLTISKEVTYIADQAFFHCLALKSITFEQGGTKALVIENGAFLDLRKLETISFPARLAEMNLEIFNECPSLSGIAVEAGGTTYGSKDGMLTNANVDTIIYTPATISGDITIPVGITAIGESAFANREGITSVTITNKVTNIGKNAFAGCNAITAVTFVGGRNTNLLIDENAFANCASLTEVNFAGLIRAAALDQGTITIGDFAFVNCAKLANVNYDASANVVAIGASAFANCTKLKKVVIPATAATIGDSAFAGCTGVSSVEFAEGTEGADVEFAFGDSVFAGCAQLRSISLPATVTKFPASGFVGCDNISEIIVDKDNPALYAEDGILYNKGQTEIMYYPKAKEVDFTKLPATITTIGAGAFQSNPKITTVIIPATITEIGAYAFDSCVNLSAVVFEANTDIKLGAYVFANCPELKTIELPTAVTAISDYAFYMSGLESISIPEAVKSIGAFAFANTKLANFVITTAVETVGAGAFANCKSLTEVTVAEGTNALAIGTSEDETGVFQGSALTTITFAKRIQSIGAKVFYNLTSLVNVTIPADAQLVSIGSYAFNNTRFTEIVLPEGLEMIGDHAFYSATAVKSISIPSTVTEIGEYAFASTRLATITFAEGTADLTVHDYAFAYNTAIKTINLPKRLVKIYDSVTIGNGIKLTTFYTVFDGCNALTDITVTDGCAAFSDVDGVFYINNNAGDPEILVYCPRGKSGTVTVPNTVTHVENLAFYMTNALEKVVFTDVENWNGVGTLTIGDSEYYSWKDTHKSYAPFKSTSIKEVDLPVQLSRLGSAAFYEMTAADFVINFDANSAPVRIGVFAIYGNSKMTKLELPRVEMLYENAIYNNAMLETLTFGKGSTLTEIGAMSIYGCKALKAVEVPASVTKIGRNGISSCAALASITFEEGSRLRELDGYAFQNTGIQSFVLPESVETIGTAIFSGCKSLETLTLSARMSSVYGVDGGSVLAYASGIKEIIVPASNNNMVVVDGILYSKDMTVLMFCPPAMDHSNITIPETVTAIEDYAFYNFTGTSLKLPGGLVKIGKYAFGYAKNMTALDIPASVRTIGDYAFTSTNLQQVTFAPSSVLESIGAEAFFYCPKLVEIDIPDSVTTLGRKVFNACSNLETVGLPSGIKAIPSGLFYDCWALKNVTIYEGVETIEDGAFNNCRALETINLPASLVTIEWSYTGAFQGCSALKNVTFAEGSRLAVVSSNTFTGCTALEEIVFPASFDILDDKIFVDCANLTSVTFLGNIQTIPAGFFAGFEKLTTVVLPATVKEIGENAFDGCSSLVNITIPAAVETIGTAAFRNCESIERVAFGANLTKIGDYAFDGCAKLSEVTFDENCSIAALGTDATVESAIFRGTTALKSIKLPATVRSIGANIFENSGLESVELPESLIAVSNYAFSGCAFLTSISIPETVKSIGEYALADCAGLKRVEIAFGVESIGAAAFLNCVSLETVNVPATIRIISGNPFINCPNLANFDFDNANTDFVFEDGTLFDADKYTLIYYLPTNVPANGVYEVPSTVREFAAGAFYGSQIVSFKFPDNMKRIPDMLLMDSKKLETVMIPKSITAIGAQAFQGCEALKGITINETITDIGQYAFADCTALETVSFSERNTPYTIGAHAFDGCIALSNIELAEGIIGLAPYMFANTGFVAYTIPTFITDVNVEGVFANNAKLKSVTFHENLTGALGVKFFYNCTALTEVNLSAGINQLGEMKFVGNDLDMDGVVQGYEVKAYDTASPSSVFYGCTSLERIALPGVYAIGAHTFHGCTNLKEIVLADQIAIVGDYAFAECKNLETLDMHKVTKWDNNRTYAACYLDIGKYAFYNCSNLKTLVLPDNGLGTIKDSAFEGCSSIKRLVIYKLTLGFEGSPFRGWTKEQEIFFEYYTASTVDFNLMFLQQFMGRPGYMLWFNDTQVVVIGSDGKIMLDAAGTIFDPNAR